MMNRPPQTVRTLVFAAGLAAAQTTVAYAAGEPVSGGVQAPQSSVDVTSTLGQVTKLLTVDQVVKAREVLGRLRADAVMTAEQSTQYRDLLKAVVAREQALSPNQRSMQKAELALENGEYQLAEQHAKAVASSSKIAPDVKVKAEQLVAKVDAARKEAALAAPGMVRAAVNAYDMGKYAEARQMLESVVRAGVELPAAEAGMLNEYRDRIVALAATNADLFKTASAGMLQPGEVQARRPENPEAAPEQPAAGAVAPAAQPADDAIAASRKNEAGRELARANELFEQKKYADALAAYQNLKGSFGDVLTAEQTAQVNANLASSQAGLATQATSAPAPAAQPAGALNDYTQTASIQKQQATAEFNNFMMEAKKSLDQGETGIATSFVARAQNTLSQSKQLFSEPERLQLQARVDALSADVQKRANEIAAAENQAREANIRKSAQDNTASELAAKSQKIRESINRVRTLQRDRKYREALDVCKEILFLDPNNPTGLLLRDVLQDMIVYSTVGAIDTEKSRSYVALSINNVEAAIAPTNTVTYPKDWPQLSNTRSEALAFQDTPDNRRVIAALEATRIPKAELADIPFEASLKYLQTFANVNMDIDWPSLEAIGVQKDTAISMSLTNPTVKTVLEQVLSKAAPSGALDPSSRAGWTVYDGVLHIGSEPALRKNKVMVIYDVQDLLFEVRDKVNVPQLDIQQAFQQSGQGGGGGGQAPFQQTGQQARQQGQGLQRPFEERLRDLRNIIVEQVDKDGWTDNGGDTGTIQVFQQNLIVTNTPKNHRAVEGLLSQLRRVRNMQINVEARFLVVSSDFFEKIGFDVDLYLNAHGNQTRFLRGFNYAFMPSEFFPQGRYSGNNASSTNRVFDSDGDGIPDAPLTGGGPAAPPPENFSVVGIANGSLGLTSRLMTSPFATEVTQSGTGAPALGISGTFLDDVQVDFLLEATQADRRAVSLNAPRLTFTNGQTANVWVARQIAYISDLEPQVADNAVVFDPTTGFVNDGVTLLVSGVILADRRYVQLDVETQVSNSPQDSFRRIEVSGAAAGGGGNGGGGGGQAATATAFYELPQGQIQSVSTTVTVPDMGTVLLGGQRVTNEVEVESGVPVLSKIPIINRFFSNRSVSREERSLLMLIRPEILIQDETEDKFFPGLREAIRTGGYGS